MPFSMYPIGKLPGQSLVVASATGQQSHSRLFFVRDTNNSLNFLVDTGAEVSLLPATSADRRKQQLGFQLQAANNSTISTYGTRSLTLDFNLRRSLPWIFTIADVRHAILGADFLRHYQLLIDMKHKRLVHSITRLEIRGIISPHIPLKPIWQIVSPSTPINKLLAKYPSITHPSSLNRPIKHSVTHSINTTGPSIRCRTRRLAPDRLKLAREEFDHMLQLGIIRPSSSSWSSPLHMVPKKVPGDWRPCRDCRILNSKTARSLPHTLFA